MMARLSAGAMVSVLVGCSSPVAQAPAPELAACLAEVSGAASYGEGLADAREKRMMVMRFASAAAMQAFTDETLRIRNDAQAMRDLQEQLEERLGQSSVAAPAVQSDFSEEGATQRFVSARACAQAALK